MIKRNKFGYIAILGAVGLVLARWTIGYARTKQPDTPPRTSPSFSDLDKDHDGRLTLDEFKAGFQDLANPEEKFKSLDTNGDGFLSISEYKAGYPDPIPPKKVAKNGKKAANVDPKKVAKQFAKLDSNGDGKLSLDEFKAGYPKLPNPENKFQKLDNDGDGFLSLEEFTAGQPIGGKKQKKAQ